MAEGQSALDVENFSEFVEKLKEISPQLMEETILLVAEIKFEGIFSMLGPKDQSEKVQEMMVFFQREILDHDQLRYRERLHRAFAKSPEDFRPEIDSMLFDTIQKISPNILNILTEGLKSKKFFASEQEAKNSALEIDGYLQKCLQESLAAGVAQKSEISETCLKQTKGEVIRMGIDLSLEKYVPLLTTDQEFLQRYQGMIKQSLDTCSRQGGDWSQCLTSAVAIHLPPMISEAMTLVPDLFASDDSVEKSIQACLKQSESYALKQDLVQYFNNLTRCMTSWTLEDLLAEYRRTQNQQGSLDQLLHALEDIFKADPNILELMASRSSRVTRPNKRTESFLELWQKINPEIKAYFAQLDAFDLRGGEKAIADFKNQVLKAIERDNSLTLEQFDHILLTSKLSPLLIESMIANKIKQIADEVLSPHNVGEEQRSKLSSAQMIQRVFRQTSQGQKTMQNIKENYMTPLLKGSLSLDEVTQRMAEIKQQIGAALVADNQLGGFVETIFSDIVQIKLDEIKEQTKKAPVARTIVFWWKKIRPPDFQWGPPKNLRETCGGRKAIQVFAEHILKPTFVEHKELTEKEIDEISEKFIMPYMTEALLHPKTVESLDQC